MAVLRMAVMRPEILRHLSKKPSALLKYRQTGRLPRHQVPESPLITFLERMPVRELRKLQWVKLSPKIGYSTGMRFNSAAQMLRYLKPQSVMIGGGTWPAESHRIKSFNRPVTPELFLAEALLV